MAPKASWLVGSRARTSAHSLGPILVPSCPGVGGLDKAVSSRRWEWSLGPQGGSGEQGRLHSPVGNCGRDSTAALPFSPTHILLLLGFGGTDTSWMEHHHTLSDLGVLWLGPFMAMVRIWGERAWRLVYQPVLFYQIGLVVFILYRVTFRLGMFMYFFGLLLPL